MMNGIKTIIADDEALVRERLESLISKKALFEIVARCVNAPDTIKAINGLQADLIFLDIRMPGGDGFKVLDRSEHQNLMVIFITAYDQFALKAFDYAAFDYLVKPITESRFDKTVHRIEQHFMREVLLPEETLVVNEKGVYHKVNIVEITHIEAADNYVKIYRGERALKKRITLSKLFERLEGMHFIRVHRSYIVNERHIREMAKFPDGDYLIRLSNGRVVPSSKSYRASVKRLHIDKQGD